MSYPASQKFNSSVCVAVKADKNKKNLYHVVAYEKKKTADGHSVWKALPKENEVHRHLPAGPYGLPLASDYARHAAKALNCAFIPHARNNSRCDSVAA